MSKKFFTIQIIPENSGKIKSFKIPVFLWKGIKILFVILACILAFGIYKISDITSDLMKLEKISNTNAELIKKQRQYEEYFSTLDSIFVMDLKLKQILGLFLESDTAKIHKFLEKNQLAHQPSSKNEIDFEGRYGWIPISEKIKAEQIPDVIPVSGIVSKKFNEELKHFGIDFAAKEGDPVYASASGKIISVKESSDLGLTITIDHHNGYLSTYSHLKNAYVSQNASVNKGSLIGAVGSTGKTSGPHLHFTISKNGTPVNPDVFFQYR